MRIMIGAGGTGGHVYPALAAAEAVLKHTSDAHELCFVGTADRFERPLVEASGIPFAHYDEVLAGPIHAVNPLRAVTSVLKLIVGVLQAFGIMIKRRPKSILLTGGWANLPVAIVAWVLRIPLLVYLPDIEPGLTIRVLKYFAGKVAITVPESEQYFRAGQTVVTGYPLRQKVMEATREAGIKHFGLDPDRPCVLFFGGSRGARSINIAAMGIMRDLIADGVQVIHVTGELDWPRVQNDMETLKLKDEPAYHVMPYLHEMGLAFAVADVVVCRAGASTLGELPYFGLASILVPIPGIWDYQKTNANYLADRGASIHMPDERMVDDLLPTLRKMLQDRAALSQMQQSARALIGGDGADNLAREWIELGGVRAW